MEDLLRILRNPRGSSKEGGESDFLDPDRIFRLVGNLTSIRDSYAKGRFSIDDRAILGDARLLGAMRAAAVTAPSHIPRFLNSGVLRAWGVANARPGKTPSKHTAQEALGSPPELRFWHVIGLESFLQTGVSRRGPLWKEFLNLDTLQAVMKLMRGLSRDILSPDSAGSVMEGPESPRRSIEMECLLSLLRSLQLWEKFSVRTLKAHFPVAVEICIKSILQPPPVFPWDARIGGLDLFLLLFIVPVAFCFSFLSDSFFSLRPSHRSCSSTFPTTPKFPDLLAPGTGACKSAPPTTPGACPSALPGSAPHP